MTRHYLAALAFGLASSTAMAADLPVRSSAPAPYLAAPVFTWAGPYVGINLGGAFNNNNNNLAAVPFGFPGGLGGSAPAAANMYGAFGTGNNSSFVYGAQIGYNFQSGAIVYGVEADIQGLARSGNNGAVGVVPVLIPGTVPYAVTFNQSGSARYFGTVRGRLGYAMDRVLFYATAGFAYGGNRSSGQINYFAQNNPGVVPTAVYGATGNSSRVGFAVGAGIEYAVTNNITIRGEYLYADIGRRNNLFTTATVLPVNLTGSSFAGGSNNRGLNVVRVGVNYKF